MTLRELAEDVLGNAMDGWFESPNPQFADRRPRDLVGTEEEFKVYRLLNAAAHGLY